MDDEIADLSPIEALRRLGDYSGQSYVRAREASAFLSVFPHLVTDEYVYEHYPYADPDEGNIEDGDQQMALSHHLADTQRAARDTRGIVNVAPHVMLVTYSDVTEIIAEALTGESSDHSAGGAGFTADGRHDENVEIIKESLGAAEA